MERTIEIVGSFTGKINTGNYEQDAPFFSLKETITGEISDSEIQARQKQLEKFCYNSYMDCVDRTKKRLFAEKMKGFKFIEKDGKQYIRVSSILQDKFPINLDKEILQHYANNGTLHHKVAEIYFKEGREVTPIEADEELYNAVKEARFQMNGKSLSIDPDKINFHNYWNQHCKIFEVEKVEERVFNEELGYTGCPDMVGKLSHQNFIGDIKTWPTIRKTSSEQAFIQMAFYALCGIPCDIMAIFPIGTKEPPIISTDVEGYKKKALEIYESFKNKYNY